MLVGEIFTLTLANSCEVSFFFVPEHPRSNWRREKSHGDEASGGKAKEIVLCLSSLLLQSNEFRA